MLGQALVEDFESVDPNEAEDATAEASCSRDQTNLTDDVELRPVHWTPDFDGIRRFVEGTQAVTWVFTGDDATDEAVPTKDYRSYPEIFAQRVRWELRRLLDVVINTGVPAGSLKNLSNNLDWRVLRFQPEVVSVMVGMQDSIAGPSGRDRFRQLLEQIVEELRDQNIFVLLNTPAKILTESCAKYQDTPAYADLMRDVARNSRVALVDHWHHWEQDSTSANNLAPWLSEDGIHPTANGHREIARWIYNNVGSSQARAPAVVDHLH